MFFSEFKSYELDMRRDGLEKGDINVEAKVEQLLDAGQVSTLISSYFGKGCTLSESELRKEWSHWQIYEEVKEVDTIFLKKDANKLLCRCQ